MVKSGDIICYSVIIDCNLGLVFPIPGFSNEDSVAAAASAGGV